MKLVRSPIPASQWETFFPKVQLPEKGFDTLTQAAADWGISYAQAGKRMRDLVESGRAKMRYFKPLGSRQPIPHYKAIPNEKLDRKNQKHRRHR